MRRVSNLHCFSLFRASSQLLIFAVPTLTLPSPSRQVNTVGLELMVGAYVGDKEGCLEGTAVGNTFDELLELVYICRVKECLKVEKQILTRW